MKIKNLGKICLVSFMFFIVNSLHANSDLSIGQKLSEKELVKLQGSEIQVGNQSFKVIQETSPSNRIGKNNSIQADQKTFITDTRGIVGTSQNIVLISETSPNEIHSLIKNITNSAINVHYYDHLNITSLRFSNFKQAVNAYNELVKLLPNSKITLPITFTEKNIK